MRVQCALCDQIDTIKDNTFIAKRLKNHSFQSYLCDTCKQRITDRTIERKRNENFRLYRDSHHHHKRP